MPWKSWFDGRGEARSTLLSTDMPLTMVTLLGRPGVSPAEYAFYAAAEMRTMREWADEGVLLLAFPSIDLDEMTLICTEMLEQMRQKAGTLPLVMARLVTAEVRSVVSLRLVPSLEASRAPLYS